MMKNFNYHKKQWWFVSIILCEIDRLQLGFILNLWVTKIVFLSLYVFENL